MIHNHSGRLRSLALYLPSEAERSGAHTVQIPFLGTSKASPSEFTILQSVELSQVNRFLDAPLILAVQRAPLLNSAVLLSFDKLSQQPSPPPFSWHQLKHLDISTSDGCSFPELQTLSALVQCTSLQTLILRHDQIRTDNHVSFYPLPVLLETLHTLEIRFSLPDWLTVDYKCLTSRLTLPSLRNLTLRHVRWNMDNDLKSLIAMLERSSCAIQTLEITGIVLGDVAVLTLLRHPSLAIHLEKLILKGHPTGYLFDRIAGDSGLLPQLEELYVSMAFGDRQGVVLSPPIRDILSLGRWSQTRGWSKTRAMKIVDLEFYWDNYDMDSVRRLREFDNFRIRRLEQDSAILEDPDLRDEILAIRQLGGILKESLVLSHRGTFVENKLFENLPSINSLFNELESLLQHVNLTDAELKWVGETHYVLLTVVFCNVGVLRNSEFLIMERANGLLQRFIPVSGHAQGQGQGQNEEDSKGARTLFRSVKRIGRAVKTHFRRH
ncbi:hypothetical protein L218DRAFT_1006721 [Marasmius fiardii PR-910]|nr:hypothetical protein L218DRAFT_1006721 [Marasmius fiardii PR-910]